MIDWKAAEAIVDRLDLDSIPACPMCLFELAWAMHKGRSGNAIASTLTTTCDWVWMEIDAQVEARLARLAMRGVRHAAEAARDVRLNGWQSRLVRVLVLRLARRMADELDSEDPPDAAGGRAAVRRLSGRGGRAQALEAVVHGSPGHVEHDGVAEKLELRVRRLGERVELERELPGGDRRR